MKPWGYWKDIDNIKKEAISILEEYGISKFNYSDLYNLGLNSFLSALNRSNYTLSDLCLDLNIEYKSTAKGYWKDIDNIIKECNSLVDKYGCLPNRETIKSENKLGMLNAISKFHGGLNYIRKIIEPELYKSNLSIFERTTKFILDKYIEDNNYIDNGRKSLLEYNLDTRNPNTGNYLEIDRYYYNLKIAIEINGQQHYKKGGDSTFWSQERYEKSIILDSIKANILKENNIKLICISYTDNTEEKILNILKKYSELNINHKL